MSEKVFVIYLLGVSLFAASGCVSNRDVAQNTNNVSIESGGGSVKKEDVKAANSAVAPNVADANKPAVNAPVKEVSAVKETAFAHLKPEHAAALKAWMTQRRMWEPAQETDYKKELLEYAKQDKDRKNYHPYYAVGDFSGDGKEDFGVGLVDSKTRKKLAFAVFNHPFASGKSAFFTDRTDRDDIVSEDEGYVYIGADYSDNGYRLEPIGDKYKVQMFADEMP